MSTNPSTLQRARAKPLPDHVQTVIAGSVYAFFGASLSLYESHARAVEAAYGLPSCTQYLLGYRSAPEAVRYYVEHRNEDVSRWLDSLSDDEFLDWFTYSKTPLYTYVRADAPAQELNLTLDLLELELAQRFGSIEGVPGLYVDDRLRVKMPRSGVIVPCRINGIIRALLAYPSPGETKRFWLSSVGLNGGVAARATLHIANEHAAVRHRVAILVTHTIEADARAKKTGECVIAVNGVPPLRLPYALRSALPDLKGCLVAPELDDHLARTLRENGFRVRVDEMEGEDES